MICGPAIDAGRRSGTRAHKCFAKETMMFAILALAAAAPAAAQDFQSTPLVDMIVAQFTGHQIGDTGGARTPVDPRLKLTPCTAPQLSWRTEAQDAVVVRCMAPEWRIFVPVNAVARPKAAPALMRVAAVAAPVPAKVEPVIRRGDAVTIEAGSPGFSITREGVAMGDAAPGGRLMIKVQENKAPIQAVAVEPGRAKLPGWDE
jgi:flagella basal body P-ring formation protein FlgA